MMGAPTPPDRLVIYTVFDRPDDHPDGVVVARDVIGPGTVRRLPQVWCFDTVGRAREFLGQLGLDRMDRDPGDVPSLVEVWF